MAVLAKDRITFVVSVTCRGEELESNFLASPCLQGSNGNQILIQEGYESAAKAYNDAIDRAEHDLIVFAHQDVIFPKAWISQLQSAIEYLTLEDPNWGVLGCYGLTSQGNAAGYIYSPGRGIIGRPFGCPTPIQTLDELVLIVRRSSGLRFDNALPHFHLYGADICLRAAQMRMKSYAICAFCIHNAHQYLILSKDFYTCCRHIRQVWKDYLPIETTCVRLTRFNIPVYERRLREAHLRYIRRKGFIAHRVKNVPQLLKELGPTLGSL